MFIPVSLLLKFLANMSDLVFPDESDEFHWVPALKAQQAASS
jgi:hypothetical protein